MNVERMIASLVSIVFMVNGANADQLPANDWQTNVAEQLPIGGEIHLALFNNGARDGFMRLGWQKSEDETLYLYDRSMLPSGELYETQEALVDAETLYPIWSKVRLHQASRIGSVDAKFEHESAIGTRKSIQPGKEETIRDISHNELPQDLTMRMTTFILPLVLSQESGSDISYHWYSPLSDQITPVTLTAREKVKVDTPAGSFETVRFELRGALPENDIYVAIGKKRRIVRIDVLDQPFQFLALP